MPRPGPLLALIAAAAYLIAGTAFFLAPPGFFVGPDGYAVMAEQVVAHPWIRTFIYGGVFIAFASILGVVLALAIERKQHAFDYGRWCEGLALVACGIGMMQNLNQFWRLQFWSSFYLDNVEPGQEGFYYAVLASQGADGGVFSFLAVGLWMAVISVSLLRSSQISTLTAWIGIVGGTFHMIYSVDANMSLPFPYVFTMVPMILLGAAWFVLIARGLRSVSRPE